MYTFSLVLYAVFVGSKEKLHSRVPESVAVQSHAPEIGGVGGGGGGGGVMGLVFGLVCGMYL